MWSGSRLVAWRFVLITDEYSTPAVSPIGERAASALEIFTVNERRTKRLTAPASGPA
jgi:hypothetical protein